MDLLERVAPRRYLITIKASRYVRLGPRRLRAVPRKESAFHGFARQCASTVLQWGFLCTERVGGPSDWSLLQDRRCIDSHESGVIWPSARAVLGCGMSLPRSQYCRRFPSEGVNLALCSHQACYTAPSATSVLSRFAKKWGNLALCSG